MFFTLAQNNSQGVFDYDEKAGIGFYVIIEAQSAADAMSRWDSIRATYLEGPYCPCCGERWYAVFHDSDGTEVPTIYGELAETCIKPYAGRGEATSFVHYLDGRIEAMGRKSA